MMLLVIVVSSLGILWFERVDGANIRTAEDALWWSVTTVTTVGYGDRYPVTTAGRVVAGALMVAGVGMFGALSGIVASLLLGQRDEQTRILEEVRTLQSQLQQLQAETAARRTGEESSDPPSPGGN